jgi:histidine kinase
MFLHALLFRPKLAPFITLKLMKLTLTHGLSMIAPLSFSTYGILCISGMYDAESAFRFGELGLELLERLEVKEYLPRLYAGFYSCIHPWKRPLRDSLPHILHAHRVGKQTGDIEYACLNANLYCFIAIDAGIPLDEIEREWAGFERTMITHRQKALLRMSAPCIEAIHLYRGKTDDASETDLLLQRYADDKLHSPINGTGTRMRTAYLFNDYELADRLSRIASNSLWSLPPTFEIVSAAFLSGMIALAMAAKGKRVWQNLRKASKLIKAMNCMARGCPSNCLDKKFLLEAELAAVRGRDAEAFEKYTGAIGLAMAYRFLHIEALANERCARFFVDRGKLPDASPYFRRAIVLYDEWGGKAKVDRLHAEMESLYPESVGPSIGLPDS